MPMTDAEIELRELRDELVQKTNLAKPTYHKQNSYAQESGKDVTAAPHDYLLIDLPQDTPDQLLHGADGIGMADLQRELEEEGLLEHISESQMNQLLAAADRDRNRQITYPEFYRMMTEDLAKEESKIIRRIMIAAIGGIIPRGEREQFLASYNCCPPPIFIPIISIAEILVFIVYTVDMDDRGIKTTAVEGMASYGPLLYTPTRRYEIWRFLTYMFLHQGYMHLILNILYQLLYGISLEMVHKWWRVGLVYMLGVIAGGLAHSICDHSIGLVGASGGVYALLGAHLAATVINWKEMNYKCMDPQEMEKNVCCGIFRVLMSAPARIAIILILMVPDTSLAIYRRVTSPKENKVGVAAHIGGFLTGIMLGIVILRNVNRLTWEVTLGWITLAIYLAFVAFCIMFNVFYDGYPPTDWSGY